MLWCVKTLKISNLPNVGFCAVGCNDFEMYKVPQCRDIVVFVMWYVQTLKFFSFAVWRLCVVVCKHVGDFSKKPCTAYRGLEQMAAPWCREKKVESIDLKLRRISLFSDR